MVIIRHPMPLIANGVFVIHDLHNEQTAPLREVEAGNVAHSSDLAWSLEVRTPTYISALLSLIQYLNSII